MEVMPVASQPIYQFYAELKDYKPLIWRRFQVAGKHHPGAAWLCYDDFV